METSKGGAFEGRDRGATASSKGSARVWLQRAAAFLAGAWIEMAVGLVAAPMALGLRAMWRSGSRLRDTRERPGNRVVRARLRSFISSRGIGDGASDPLPFRCPGRREAREQFHAARRGAGHVGRCQGCALTSKNRRTTEEHFVRFTTLRLTGRREGVGTDLPGAIEPSAVPMHVPTPARHPRPTRLAITADLADPEDEWCPSDGLIYAPAHCRN